MCGYSANFMRWWAIINFLASSSTPDHKNIHSGGRKLLSGNQPSKVKCVCQSNCTHRIFLHPLHGYFAVPQAVQFDFILKYNCDCQLMIMMIQPSINLPTLDHSELNYCCAWLGVLLDLRRRCLFSTVNSSIILFGEEEQRKIGDKETKIIWLKFCPPHTGGKSPPFN